MKINCTENVLTNTFDTSTPFLYLVNDNDVSVLSVVIAIIMIVIMNDN
jgi:hypothetical protein